MNLYIFKFKLLLYFLTRNPLKIENYLNNVIHCIDFFLLSPKLQTGVIETSNICNLNCIMCETQEGGRAKGKISWELFTKAADYFYDAGIKNISFHTINEPLLDDKIIDKLEYLNNKGMKLLLTTNGTLVDRFIDAVQEKGLKNFTIRFSIDGATKETFEKIRRGADFDKVINNLKKTFEYKQNHYKNLEISVNYCVNQDTINEIPIFINNYSKYFDKMLFPLITAAFLKGSNNDFFKDKSYKSFTRMPCFLPFRGLWVLYNGQVSACCADNLGELVVGDINESPIIDIWNGKNLLNLRKQHLFNNKEKIPNKCKRCKFSNYQVGRIIQKIIDRTVKSNKDVNGIPDKILFTLEKYEYLSSFYDL